MNRREMLQAGLGVGALGALGGAAHYAVLPPPQLRHPGSLDALAQQVHAELRRVMPGACLDYDHPLRQVHNRGVRLGGALVSPGNLSFHARCALSTVVHHTLSSEGCQRLLTELPSRYTGVNLLHLQMFGTPGEGPWQMLLSGVHLNLRIGSVTHAGTAFGGPQVYGDQRGNHQPGLPGNVFRYQMMAAHALLAQVSPATRRAVRVAQAPPQTCIAVQGREGRFDGVPVADLPAGARRQAQGLVRGILGNYGEEAGEDAWQCLQRNGGVDALCFADYDVDFQGGAHAGDKPSQIFRLEGPAAVLHFRGQPHVHAFVSVERDVEQPLSLGEVLGVNEAPLAGDSLRAWYESAMRNATHADHAEYPPWSVVGRLRAGPIRTGDVWAAEIWRDALVVCELSGEDIAPQVAARMAARGNTPQAHRRYRIATTGFAAEEEPSIGKVRSAHNRGLLRDALVAQARVQGFRI